MIMAPCDCEEIFGKSMQGGIQFWRVHSVSIFIRFAVVASQSCEIPRNSPKIRTYSSSRSSIVVSVESALRIMQLPTIVV